MGLRISAVWCDRWPDLVCDEPCTNPRLYNWQKPSSKTDPPPWFTIRVIQVYHSLIRICEMNIFTPVRKTFIMFVTFIHRKHSKHIRLLSPGTKLFITFEFKGSGFSIPPPSRAAPVARKFLSPLWAPKVNRLLPRQDPSQLTDFFKIPQILRARASGAWRHSHSLVNLSIGFLFWHLWMTHTPCARINTCTQVCT